MLANIAILGIDHGIDGIRPASLVQVRPLPGDNVRMQVRNALACIGAILHCYVEAGCFVHSLDHAANTLDSEEEVGDFGMREFCKPWDSPSRTNQDMAGKQRLDVDQGKRIWCVEKNLGVISAWWLQAEDLKTWNLRCNRELRKVEFGYLSHTVVDEE